MKYQALLFDADGTLLDFKKSEENGLRSVFTYFPVPDRKSCEAYYKELNQKLWDRFEKGEITKQTIFDTRFSKLCSYFNLPYDGILMEAYYRKCLNEGHDLIDGAYELIKALSKQYSLYIITNGVAQTQYRRLKDSHLLPFFQAIFVSEEIGYQKPDRAYFDYVCTKVPCKREQMLVVGDSLNCDILGAQRSQIASVWFHTDHQDNAVSVKPDYEIHALEELWSVL